MICLHHIDALFLTPSLLCEIQRKAEEEALRKKERGFVEGNNITHEDDSENSIREAKEKAKKSLYGYFGIECVDKMAEMFNKREQYQCHDFGEDLFKIEIASTEKSTFYITIHIKNTKILNIPKKEISNAVFSLIPIPEDTSLAMCVHLSMTFEKPMNV